MWYNIRASAKNLRELEFNIDPEDIIIPSVCPVYGVPMNKEGERSYYPTVDRIDSSKGYVKGNVRVISHLANRHKNNMTFDHIEMLYQDALRLKGEGF